MRAAFPSMSPTTLLIWASASLIGFRLSVENSTTALLEHRAAPAHVHRDRAEEHGEAEPADERRVRLVPDHADDRGDDEDPDQPQPESTRTHTGAKYGHRDRTSVSRAGRVRERRLLGGPVRTRIRRRRRRGDASPAAAARAPARARR